MEDEGWNDLEGFLSEAEWRARSDSSSGISTEAPGTRFGSLRVYDMANRVKRALSNLASLCGAVRASF